MIAGIERALPRRLAFSIWVATLPLFAIAAIYIVGGEIREGAPNPVVVLGTYSVVQIGTSILVTSIIIRRELRAATRWLAEDRPSTDAERLALARFPFRHAMAIAPWWLPSVGLGFLMNMVIVEWPGTMLVVGASVSVLLAGAVCSGLVALLTEDVLRPVYARAFADGVPPGGQRVRTRLYTFWVAGSASYLVGVLAIIVLMPDDVVRWAVVSACGIGFVVGFAMANLATRSFTDPLAEVAEGLRRLEAGDLDARVDVDDGGEVGRLQTGFNRMAAGLAERERVRGLFGHRVGGEVAKWAAQHDGQLGPTVRTASVIYVDVIGSTTLAAERHPTAVVAMLNAMFEAVVRHVRAEGGFVNQFQGDGALCLFGVPNDLPDHAERARRAAEALCIELRTLGETYPGFAAAIGVATGSVVAGDIGTPDRHEFTVIGDAVNEAVRACIRAKSSEGRIEVARSASRDRPSTAPGAPV